MSDWFYNLTGKVQSTFGSLLSVVAIFSGIIGWLGGLGVLIYQGGYWLLEGKLISIAINDILSTPQYFVYTFKGVHKIIEWIFELPLAAGFILFGTVMALVSAWLSDKITPDDMEIENNE